MVRTGVSLVLYHRRILKKSLEIKGLTEKYGGGNSSRIGMNGKDLFPLECLKL
jgi:hypothetical protein